MMPCIDFFGPPAPSGVPLVPAELSGVPAEIPPASLPSGLAGCSGSATGSRSTAATTRPPALLHLPEFNSLVPDDHAKLIVLSDVETAPLPLGTVPYLFASCDDDDGGRGQRST